MLVTQLTLHIREPFGSTQQAHLRKPGRRAENQQR